MPDKVFRLGDLDPDRPLDSYPEDAVFILDDSELWEPIPGINPNDFLEE